MCHSTSDISSDDPSIMTESPHSKGHSKGLQSTDVTIMGFLSLDSTMEEMLSSLAKMSVSEAPSTLGSTQVSTKESGHRQSGVECIMDAVSLPFSLDSRDIRELEGAFSKDIRSDLTAAMPSCVEMLDTTLASYDWNDTDDFDLLPSPVPETCECQWEIDPTVGTQTVLFAVGDEKRREVTILEVFKVMETTDTVRYLDFTNTLLNDGDVDAIVLVLEKASKTNTMIQHIFHGGFVPGVSAIECRNYIIGTSGVSKLANALETNPPLLHLDLSLNEIGDEGATSLAKALVTNTTLQHLDLWKNSIGMEGAAALANAMEVNTTLTNLYLYENMIGDDGATALAAALGSKSSLLSLNLGSNAIGDQGAIALAKALETNAFLQYLSLDDNEIGRRGASALMRTLRNHNGDLVEVDLSDNEIPDILTEQINSLAKENDSGTRPPSPIPQLPIPPRKRDVSPCPAYVTPPFHAMDSLIDSNEGTNKNAHDLDMNFNELGNSIVVPNESVKSRGSDEADNKASMQDAVIQPPILSVSFDRDAVKHDPHDEQVADSLSESHHYTGIRAEVPTHACISKERDPDSNCTFSLYEWSTRTPAASKAPTDNENREVIVAKTMLTLIDKYPTPPSTTPESITISETSSMIPKSTAISETSMPEIDSSIPVASIGTMVPEDSTDADSFMISRNDLMDELGYTFEHGDSYVIPAPASGNGVVPRSVPKLPGQALQDPSPVNSDSFSQSKDDTRYVSQHQVLDNDILFGDRETGSHHPGTIFFGDLVKQSRSAYESLCFEKKTRLVSTILGELSQRGRFIRRIGQGPYFLMTEEDARVVVSEALRDSQSLPPSCSSDLPVLTMPPKSAQSIGLGEIDSVVVTPPSSGSIPPSMAFVNTQPHFSPAKAERIYVSTDSITDKDVLCGREFRETNHPGNHFYLRMVAAQKDRHRSLGSKHGEKTKIRNMIVHEVVGGGGRFVKKEGNLFYLLTQAEARAKVGQSLRDNKQKAVKLHARDILPRSARVF